MLPFFNGIGNRALRTPDAPTGRPRPAHGPGGEGTILLTSMLKLVDRCILGIHDF